MTTPARRRPGPAPLPWPVLWVPWIAAYVAEETAAHRSPNSIRTRLYHLHHFAALHPDLSPLDVARADLVTYMAKQKWSPHTARGNRGSFRSFFRVLFELEHRPDDPSRTLPRIRIPRSQPRPCPDHVIQQAYDRVDDPKLLLALRIAVEAGLRRAEIAGLRTSDVEGRQGDYRLYIIGKGGHERTVPIEDDLADAILECTTVNLFPGVDGKPVTPQHLGKRITDALPGQWTTHTLRHRFATMAYQAGGRDLRAVQELMGHTSPDTTAIYTKVADASMRTAAGAARIEPLRTGAVLL